MTQIKRILILLMATLVMTEVAVEAKRPAILNQADEKAMNEWVNATLGFQLRITDAAKEFVAKKGFDSQYGARPLKRAIQTYVEDPLSELMLKNEGLSNATLLLDVSEDEIQATVIDQDNEKNVAERQLTDNA